MSRSSADTALSPPFPLPSPLDTITINMCPLVYHSATRLDGYIARPAGEVGWPFTEPGDWKQKSLRVDLFNTLLGG